MLHVVALHYLFPTSDYAKAYYPGKAPRKRQEFPKK